MFPLKTPLKCIVSKLYFSFRLNDKIIFYIFQSIHYYGIFTSDDYHIAAKIPRYGVY